MFWFYCLLCSFGVSLCCSLVYMKRKLYGIFRYVGIAFAFYAMYCHYKCMETGAYSVFSEMVAKRVVHVVQYFDHRTPFIDMILKGLGFATETLETVDSILSLCEVLVFALLILALVASGLYYAFCFFFKRH